MDTMYELPSLENVQKCVVTEESVNKGVRPTLTVDPAETSAS